MTCFSDAGRPGLLTALGALAVSVLIATGADAAPSRVDISELISSGFKVLVAKTQVQKDWVKNLPAGQIRPMQRTGKKYFIYPDAAGNQIYIGGPREYDAYHQLASGKQAGGEGVGKAGNGVSPEAGQDHERGDCSRPDRPVSRGPTGSISASPGRVTGIATGRPHRCVPAPYMHQLRAGPKTCAK